MTTTSTDGRQQQRALLHHMWESVAPAWGEHADFIDARNPELTDRMLALTAPQPGERVLELACGPGGVGLEAAPLVAPGGEVVLSDVAETMTSIAAMRASSRGLRNVTTARLDIESIDQPDHSYDVVLCRDGLQFATQPADAIREIRRILRPGGRLALVVWGPRADNPWLGVVLDAVAAQLGRPVPPPGVPGPFSIDDADRLATLLRDAGISDGVVTDVPTPMQAGTFDQWWSRTSSLAGPLANVLASLPEPARYELRGRAQQAVAPYETRTGLVFPGVALVASGHIPRQP